MKSITENQLRCGNFTSSENVKLFGEPTQKAAKEGQIFSVGGLTYIRQTNMERRLGRSLERAVSAQPLTWGKLLEPIVNNKLHTGYIYSSDVTHQHPTIPYLCGSRDCMNTRGDKAVGDIKNPISLESFCDLVDGIYLHGYTGMDAMQYAIDNHKDGEKYYIQILSNVVIASAIAEAKGEPPITFGELIVHVPFQSELETIRKEASNIDNPLFDKCRWIRESEDNELPYLLDGGLYQSLNIIRFPISESEKARFLSRIKAAGDLLIPFPVKAMEGVAA